MIYKRSSFLRLIQKKYDCTVEVLGNGALRIRHGSAISHMITNKKDEIDYEEIYMHYRNLYLPDLISSKDLDLIE